MKYNIKLGDNMGVQECIALFLLIYYKTKNYQMKYNIKSGDKMDVQECNPIFLLL